MFDDWRGDDLCATQTLFELVRLAREHELADVSRVRHVLEGWTSAASGGSGNGLEDMRRGVEQLREQKDSVFSRRLY